MYSATDSGTRCPSDVPSRTACLVAEDEMSREGTVIDCAMYGAAGATAPARDMATT